MKANHCVGDTKQELELQDCDLLRVSRLNFRSNVKSSSGDETHHPLFVC
jgi:hypothetical protein